MFVCVTSDLGAEVVFSVLTRLLISPNYGRAIVIPMSKTREKGLLESLLKEIVSDKSLMRIRGGPVVIDRLCLFGDYWDEAELAFTEKEGISCWQYSFEGAYSYKGTIVEVKPIDFLFRRIKEYYDFQRLFNPVGEVTTGTSIDDIRKYQESLDLLDLRSCGKEPLRTQPLISGLMNHPELTGSLEQRFYEFFLRPSKKFEKDVFRVGHLVTASQLEIVKERVKNNSWTKRLYSSGLTCAVTSGSEFINLMHEQLHDHYPDVPVTCVLTIWGNNGSPTLAHSLRSWDGVTDVKALVLPAGGGGSPTAAGTRIPIDLHLNY